MTADLAWLADFPGRCPDCLLHIEAQGHRSPCEPSGPLGVLLGRKLADRGMSRTVAAHPDDAAIVDAALEVAVASGRQFSANDFRHLVTKVSEPHVIGARYRTLINSKRVKRVGDTPSSSPGTHAHRIGVYEAASP